MHTVSRKAMIVCVCVVGGEQGAESEGHRVELGFEVR